MRQDVMALGMVSSKKSSKDRALSFLQRLEVGDAMRRDQWRWGRGARQMEVGGDTTQFLQSRGASLMGKRGFREEQGRGS